MTRTRLAVVGILAVLATVLGLTAPLFANGADPSANPSAKDKIEADPPPTLFPATRTHRVDSLIVPQTGRAHRLMAAYWATAGRARDDAGFVAWVEKHFPGPPTTTARRREMAEVERLDKGRTDSGVKAADWLEAHGKKDVWKLYAHDQRELLTKTAGGRRKDDVKAMLKMSKTIADTLGTHFHQSSPYVMDPKLRPDKNVRRGQVCPCSYPSRHASGSAASRTYLGRLDPSRTAQYRETEDEVDYSRLYMAGHVASDLSGGALLGDMIGEYFLVTRQHVDPAQA